MDTAPETMSPEAASGPDRDGPPEAPERRAFVRRDHAGLNYLALLSAIHRRLEPRTYLEIGSATGESLRLSRAASVAVDPRFAIASDVIGAKPSLHLMQMTSDAFFEGGHARRLLPDGVDFAFLDGLHLFEVLLRDFIHVEKLAHWRTAVAVHDCLPPSVEIAERDFRPHLRQDPVWRNHWTGDVWKLVPILRRFRPDLRLVAFDAPPSGLLLVRNLDPTSRVLERAYAAILDEYRSMELNETTFARFYDELPITPSAGLEHGTALGAFL